MNQQDVVKLMESSNTKEEWNANCDKVRQACGGYPNFWYSAIVQSGVAKKTTAKFGMTTDITVVGYSRRKPPDFYGRPTTMPRLGKGEQVVGIYDQGLGEKSVLCHSLADMQKLYDSYASGMALRLRWEIQSTEETKIPCS